MYVCRMADELPDCSDGHPYDPSLCMATQCPPVVNLSPDLPLTTLANLPAHSGSK